MLMNSSTSMQMPQPHSRMIGSFGGLQGGVLGLEAAGAEGVVAVLDDALPSCNRSSIVSVPSVQSLV
jgi:hypothetical protein